MTIIAFIAGMMVGAPLGLFTFALLHVGVDAEMPLPPERID